MDTNIKIILKQALTASFFTSGIARFTNSRDDVVFNGETYLANYIVKDSISPIKREIDMVWKGNLEAEVDFSFSVVDSDLLVKQRINHLGNFTGAKVEVYTSAQQHNFFIESVACDDSIVTFSCRNLKYLADTITVLSNGSAEIQTTPASFSKIPTSIKLNNDYTGCQIVEIHDDRIPSTGQHYSAMCYPTSGITENYIVLRTRYSEDMAAWRNKSVRIKLSNFDNYIGGTMGVIVVEDHLTNWCKVAINNVQHQLLFGDDLKPKIDGVTMAYLETNTAVYQLPANVSPPLTLSFSTHSIYISESDSRYDASNNTVKIPVSYGQTEYEYIDPPVTITPFTSAEGFGIRYYPDYESYKIMDGGIELWGAEPEYLPYETSAFNHAKTVDYLRDPYKSIVVYDRVKQTIGYNTVEFVFSVTDDLKKRLVEYEKWGIGFNIPGSGRWLGNAYSYNTGGYYGLSAFAYSDNIGDFIENADGTLNKDPLIYYTEGSRNVLYSRDISASDPTNPETDTLWFDSIPTEELYLIDSIKVQIKLQCNLIWPDAPPWVRVDWIGIVGKLKNENIQSETAVILTNSIKQDIPSFVFSRHGISGTSGLSLSYVTKPEGEMEKVILWDCALANNEIIYEQGNSFKQVPLSIYSTSATEIVNIISCSELQLCDTSEFCNNPIVSWVDSKTRKEQTISFNFDTEYYDYEKSVTFSSPVDISNEAFLQIWMTLKSSQSKYGLVATQDVYIYGGTIGEVKEALERICNYSAIRRNKFSVTTTFGNYELGQRVKVFHEKLSKTNTHFGYIQKASINPTTGETEIEIVSDLSVLTYDYEGDEEGLIFTY